jgi:squalene-hopene/tetraprenyl-beta-curcumene cyclase
MKMKVLRFTITLAAIILGSLANTRAADPAAAIAANPVADISFRNEVEHAIDRGLAYLQSSQNTNGYWSSPDNPAITALAIMAFKGDPKKRYEKDPEWLAKGYQVILSSVKPDGGIHRSNLVTYNTSISMLALLAANKPEYDPITLKAREYLAGLQTDMGEKGKIDSPYDGGIGYGSRYQHSDMGNTVEALEAMYYSRKLADDKKLTGAKDLNWEAAINFLQSCQNLPAYNKESWASDDATNKGGFVYYPGHSNAGDITNAVTGKVTLLSYGSISYGGLLSYIYANMKKDDPRILAVYDWVRKNYSVSENPGMGQQGLYYYYYTMAKALSIYDVSLLDVSSDKKVDWRKDLAMKLLNLQTKDGSWVNGTARWWENDPVLVTCYVVQSLEMMHRGLSPK